MRRTGCVLTFVLWAASAWAQDGAALYAAGLALTFRPMGPGPAGVP